MNRKRSLGEIAWDQFIFGWCAFILAMSMTDNDWKAAIRYVLFGVMVLAFYDSVREWREAMQDRTEKRRARKAAE